MYEEIFLALIVSIDTYLASASYCNSGIKIPVRSAVIIASLSAAILSVSIKFSCIISRHIPEEIFKVCSTACLTLTGLFIIVRSMVRMFSQRLSANGIKNKSDGIFMKLFLDDTAADLDNSKILSVPEAAVLAAVSSVDCAAMGIGSGFTGIRPAPAFAFTLVTGTISFLLGGLTGKKFSSLSIDMSWTGGILIILFAFFGI